MYVPGFADLEDGEENGPTGMFPRLEATHVTRLDDSFVSSGACREDRACYQPRK